MLNVVHHHWIKRRISKSKNNKNLNFLEKIFDNFVLIGALFGPLATVPQILQIWQNKNAAGVSVISWGGYFLGSFVWLAYGLLHKQKPIIVSNLLFSVFTFLIVLGTLLYGK